VPALNLRASDFFLDSDLVPWFVVMSRAYSSTCLMFALLGELVVSEAVSSLPYLVVVVWRVTYNMRCLLLHLDLGLALGHLH
jgi:hypothetical protein